MLNLASQRLLMGATRRRSNPGGLIATFGNAWRMAEARGHFVSMNGPQGLHSHVRLDHCFCAP